MLTHQEIWQAIDNLAETNGFSTSGLAKKAGLDPTSFNKSKRFSPDGKPRWPSMESVSKILAVCEASLSDLDSLKHDSGIVSGKENDLSVSIPLLSVEDAILKEGLDNNGLLNIQDPDLISFPFGGRENDPHIYALEISVQNLSPKYKEGSIIIVSPFAQQRRGDSVIVKTSQSQELLFGELRRLIETRMELLAYGQLEQHVRLDMADVIWISRILWASQ